MLTALNIYSIIIFIFVFFHFIIQAMKNSNCTPADVSSSGKGSRPTVPYNKLMLIQVKGMMVYLIFIKSLMHSCWIKLLIKKTVLSLTQNVWMVEYNVKFHCCIRRGSTLDFSGFHTWKFHKMLRVSCESNVGNVVCACFCSSRVEAGAGAVGGAGITLS